MKDLKAYLYKIPNSNVFYLDKINEYQEKLIEFYGKDNIPADILEDLNNGNIRDYIGENLKTHNYKLLQKKILQSFKDYIYNFTDQYGNNDVKSFTIDSELDLSKNSDFLKLIEFFNYTIRQVIQYINGQKYLIIIEPIYSQDMTDYVFKICKGIVYHFTDNETAKYILSNGLKIRSNKNRNTPERIYVYATPNYINNADEENVKKFIKSIIDWNKFKKYGYCCLKIDLNRLHRYDIQFYKDTAMVENESLFTLTSIPKECISICGVGNKIIEDL